MQIERTFYLRSMAIAAIMLCSCAFCTGGAFATLIPVQEVKSGLSIDNTLAGTGWQLVSYDQGNFYLPVATGSKITLVFNTDGSIGGTGGINLYFGSYTQNGKLITVGPIGCTEMAGPEPLMDQESTFFRLLDSARSFESDGASLELYDETGRIVLKFRILKTGNSDTSAAPDPVDVLPGTEWELQSYSDGDAVVSGQDISTITLKFDDDENLSGFSGVNTYFGTYTLDADVISIGPLGSTKMAGPYSLMELENSYLELLSSATEVRLEGDTLRFIDTNGNVVLEFHKKTVARESRSRIFAPANPSHPAVTSGQWVLDTTRINDRNNISFNWNSSTNPVTLKRFTVQKGLTTSSPAVAGLKPSMMPRFNESIKPPVSYPGGPLF